MKTDYLAPEIELRFSLFSALSGFAGHFWPPHLSVNASFEHTFSCNSARVKDSIPHEHVCQASGPTPTGITHAKNACSEGALDKNVHQLAQAMLTTLEGVVPQ